MEVITVDSAKIIESNKVIDSKIITNKCYLSDCKSKLKLTDFPCKCSQRFCSKHRLPETHSCSYDFKKDKINLVKVVADKVIRI
jgi:predicted nucleic acid binding AN1-type Zn finger protein